MPEAVQVMIYNNIIHPAPVLHRGPPWPWREGVQQLRLGVWVWPKR